MARPADGPIMPWLVEELPRHTDEVTFFQEPHVTVFSQCQNRHFRRFVIQVRCFFDIHGKDAHRIEDACLLSMDTCLHMNRIRHRIDLRARNDLEDDIHALLCRNIDFSLRFSRHFPVIGELVNLHRGADGKRRFVGQRHRHVKRFRRIIYFCNFRDVKAIGPFFHAISIPAKRRLKQT